MARAYGVNAQLLGASEVTYGVAAAGGYAKLPFVSIDLGAEQGLVDSNVLGQGRDKAPATQDVIKDEGSVVVPVDVRNIGQWLTWLLGPATTTGAAAPYTHSWDSGAAALPSFDLEIGLPDVGQYFLQLGCMADTLALDFKRSGNADATITVVAQGETIAGVSGGGAPTQATLTRFSQFQGSIKKDGVTLGGVTAAKLTYANKLEQVLAIRADGKIDGADPTFAELTGEVDIRFTDAALMTAASAGTPMALEFAYSLDASNSLTVTAHHVLLPKPKLSVTGPGGIQCKYNFQAGKDPVLGKMATFVLVNDVAAYA